MSQEVKQIRIQSRVDTKVNWSNENPILLDKEIGYERETGQYKIGIGQQGDGSLEDLGRWNNLPYATSGVGQKTRNNGEIFNDYENNIAISSYSHAEGCHTLAQGDSSHAEGINTLASGKFTHAEGNKTHATAESAHAEGYGTIANGIGSHSEGTNTQANGNGAHAEGDGCIANAARSHAEGQNTQARAVFSHAEGLGTYIPPEAPGQHVQGKYNKQDNDGIYAHIVGNGTSEARSNAHTLDWNGNAWFAGGVTVGKNSDKLATEKKVDSLFSFGTKDLVAGSSPLETGKLYFVYE